MIHVEFYGIPRRRAGTAQTDVALPDAARLGDVLREVGSQFPSLASECLEGERLRPGYVANIDGEQFVVDPDTPVSSNSCVLIMTADPGG